VVAERTRPGMGIAQEVCKVAEAVILSVAKNLRSRDATPHGPTRFFATLRMTAPPPYSPKATLQFSWGIAGICLTQERPFGIMTNETVKGIQREEDML
jgi:hypothetical protein